MPETAIPWRDRVPGRVSKIRASPDVGLTEDPRCRLHNPKTSSLPLRPQWPRTKSLTRLCRAVANELQVLEHAPRIGKGRMVGNGLVGKPVGDIAGQGGTTATHK